MDDRADSHPGHPLFPKNRSQCPFAERPPRERRNGKGRAQRMADIGSLDRQPECPGVGRTARQRGADRTHIRTLTPLPSLPDFRHSFIEISSPVLEPPTQARSKLWSAASSRPVFVIRMATGYELRLESSHTVNFGTLSDCCSDLWASWPFVHRVGTGLRLVVHRAAGVRCVRRDRLGQRRAFGIKFRRLDCRLGSPRKL